MLKDEYYRPYYETINPTKQIIAQASLYVETTQVEIGGKNYPITSLILKVAGKDSNGKLSKLSEVQKTAFDTYMTNFEIPGIPLSKYSLAPNILGFSAGKCVYSPQYNQESIADAVTQAMEAFRDQITFDSTLYISRLQQYVMNNVPGVIGFSLSGTTLDSSAFTESVIMSAGYFDYIDNFENLIEYVPGN